MIKSSIENIIREVYQKLEKTSPTPRLDAEVLLSYALKKPREFVLAHPEYKLSQNQELKVRNYVSRRKKGEPIAYILGQKEFYGLGFKVTLDTLIPRPETEMLVEKALNEVRNTLRKTTIIDVGTGSGNIIISIAHNIKHGMWNNFNFYATDISQKSLRVAKHNAKKNKADKKIKFIKSNLLDAFIQNEKYNLQDTNLIIIANLPYLSQKIYSSTTPDVKNFEPRRALISNENGLSHYKKLLKQLQIIKNNDCKLKIILEFSPEQKSKIQKMILKYFPEIQIEFKKDLAGKWRMAVVNI